MMMMMISYRLRFPLLDAKLYDLPFGASHEVTFRILDAYGKRPQKRHKHSTALFLSMADFKTQEDPSFHIEKYENLWYFRKCL